MPIPPVNRLVETLTHDVTLDTAYEWLVAGTEGVATITCHHWQTLRPLLQEQLGSGEYAFHVQTRVHRDNETYDLWTDQDRIVLKALTMTLEPELKEHVSRRCFDLEGRGGAKAAVRQTREYLQGNQHSWVMQSDVAGSYAHIDHHTLYGRLKELIPSEQYILRLLWQYMNRIVYDNGNYLDIDKGISPGCSLSPLMGSLYLGPLDTIFEETGGFYGRFMEEWVLIVPTRWQLHKAVKQANICRAGLGLELDKYEDKTFIGRSEKGFDFLGYHLTPHELSVSDRAIQRPDEKIARLYEQGAETGGIVQYMSRWQKWARAGVGVLAGATALLPLNALGTYISSPYLSGDGPIDLDGDGMMDVNLSYGGGVMYLYASGSLARLGAAIVATSASFGEVEPNLTFRIVGAGHIRVKTSNGYYGWLTMENTGSGSHSIYSSFYGWSPRNASLLPDGSSNGPFCTGMPTDIVVSEDSASNLILSGITFFSGRGTPLTVTLSGSAGTMAAVSGGDVIVAGSGTGILTLVGTAANITLYLDTISNIKYTGASNVKGNDAATLTINADDGTENLELGIVNIDITPQNDAPTASGIPTDFTAIEATPTDLDLSAVTFSDVDDGDTLRVTLLGWKGTFTAAGGGVLVEGSGTDTLTLEGTAAEINTYLDTASNIQYTGATDVSGDNADLLLINADDGTVNPLLGIVNIDITPLNGAPAFTGTPTITGALRVDQTLGLADTGTNDVDGDTVTLSYQWKADGTAITGATSATYTATADELGKTVTCTITADDNNGGVTLYTTAGVEIKNSFPWAEFIPVLVSPNKAIRESQ